MLTHAAVSRAVGCAVRAPSLHNSQPWSFEHTGNSVTVHADHTRWLRHEDPLHREQLISCGGAVRHLVLGLRVEGFDVAWDLSPAAAPLDSRVAVVTAVGRRPPSWQEQHLYSAACGRHTDRSPFTPHPVPPSALQAAARIAARSGLVLDLLDARQVEALAILTDQAEQALHGDTPQGREQRAWTSDEVHPMEGVPLDAVPRPRAGFAPEVPLRDFRPGPRPQAPGDQEHATFAVLSSTTDDRTQWITTGWVLSEVLLMLADRSLSASPVTQSLEIAGLRACLRAACELTAYPQMVLRLGYSAGFGSPRTARRPVDEVLT